MNFEDTCINYQNWFEKIKGISNWLDVEVEIKGKKVRNKRC